MAPKKEKSNSSDPDSMHLRQFEFWEGLRRHPEYKALCEGIKFLPTGSIDPTWAAASENQQLVTERLRRVKAIFRVEGIMDPDRPYNELPPGAVGEVAPESVTIGSHDLPSGQYLEGGRYITLKIDVTLPLDEIMQMVKANIGLQSAMAEVTPHATRTRFKEANESFKVYDLKKAEKTPTEIIKELWPDEFKKAEVSKGPSDYAFNKKYEILSQKYKKAGDKDWNEKAHKEANRIASGSGISILTLCQRVEDKYQAAKKRIEELAQK